MENDKLFIPIILGTSREGRKSEYVAHFMLEQAQSAGIESEIIDARDYLICATDNTESSTLAKSYEEKVVKADGFVIVSPEYNHGYSGELKLMLDMLFKQYFKKPVGICGVSAGGLGGARGVEQLRLVLIALHMLPIGEALYFSGVGKLFDDAGKIQDQSYNEKAQKFLDELVWYAKALKNARGSK